PVTVEHVGDNLVCLDAAREDLLTEVGRQGLRVQHVEQLPALEQVDAHVGKVLPLRVDDTALPQPVGGKSQRGQQVVALGLLDETAAEHVELVGVGNVAMQTDGEELRQDVHAVEAAVDAVADRDVDEAVLAGNGDGRFAAHLRQRVESRAPPATQDEAQYLSH